MPDLVAVAESAAEISICARMLRDAVAAGLLRRGAPYTLFAPSDVAFALLAPAQRARLMVDPIWRAQLLVEHSVAGALVAADLMNLTLLSMRSGAAHAVDASLGLRIGHAYLTVADMLADDGVVHVIDALLTR